MQITMLAAVSKLALIERKLEMVQNVFAFGVLGASRQFRMDLQQVYGPEEVIGKREMSDISDLERMAQEVLRMKK